MLASLYYPPNSAISNVVADITSVLVNNNLTGVSSAVDLGQSFVDTSNGASMFYGLPPTDIVVSTSGVQASGVQARINVVSPITGDKLHAQLIITFTSNVLAITTYSSSSTWKKATVVPANGLRIFICAGANYTIIAAATAPNTTPPVVLGASFLPTGYTSAALGTAFAGNGTSNIGGLGIVKAEQMARIVSNSANSDVTFGMYHASISVLATVKIKTPYTYGDITTGTENNTATVRSALPSIFQLLNSSQYLTDANGDTFLIPFGFTITSTTLAEVGTFDYGWVSNVSGVYLIHTDAIGPSGTYFQHQGSNYIKLGNYAIPAG